MGSHQLKVQIKNEEIKIWHIWYKQWHTGEKMVNFHELHGLGVKVIDDLTPEQMMQKAGVDWTVEKQDMVTLVVHL